MTSLRGRLWIFVVAGIPLAVLAIFFILPVGGMVERGFWSAGRFDPGGVLSVLGRPRTLRVLWFTTWSAGVATFLAVVLGLPAAFVLHRLRFPGRDLLRALVLVPFVLPTVVVGVAFTQLFGVGGALSVLHMEGTSAAIVAALVFFNISVVVRTVGSYWESMDPRREQAAAALGASPRQVFLTVTVPAMLPAVIAAASVVFLFCATAFGVVLTMGGLRYSNIETEIYLLTTQELDLQSAAALSLLQLVLIVVLLTTIGRVRRGPSGVDRSPEPPRRPRSHDWAVLGTTALVVGFLALPMVSLVTASLHANGSWSLDNFRALSGEGTESALLVPATSALFNSLRIAVQACALALTLGLLVSYVVTRRARGRWGRRLVAAFDGAFMLPLGVSAVTLGFGFLITLDRPPLDLRSSALLIPIAQAMVALPLVVRTVAPVWSSIDDHQRQAAASLGAGPLRVFATVDLPVASRPILAAAGFAFAVSLGEFGATSFLARDDNPTLPVVIYKLLSHPGVSNFGMAMAASVVLALATAGVIFVVERLDVSSMGTL